MACIAAWTFASVAAPVAPVPAPGPSKPPLPPLTTPRLPPLPHQAPQVWLGLQISKPDVAITAHLPSVPPGFGFVIKSIDDHGPAKQAGLQELDLLVKLGDQMLVNEAQLAALLRLSKPDDEILLSGFRAGKPFEVKLKLGTTPAGKPPFPRDLVDATILPEECGGPIRVVNIAERLATYATDDGRATVRREGDAYKVTIKGPKDELIFDGNLPPDGNLDTVPEAWRRRVSALRRGLDHALDGRVMRNRPPRPRVVPPQPQEDS